MRTKRFDVIIPCAVCTHNSLKGVYTNRKTKTSLLSTIDAYLTNNFRLREFTELCGCKTIRRRKDRFGIFFIESK